MPRTLFMPALSPTMTQGTLAKWHKHEGDIIEPGDIIADVETDKATIEFEYVDDEAICAKILIPDGTQGVTVNSPIAILLLEGETEEALENYKAEEFSATIGKQSTTENSSDNSSTQKTASPEIQNTDNNVDSDHTSQSYQDDYSSSNERIIISPVARVLAKQQNIDLTKLQGTGPYGRITKIDIENHHATSSSVIQKPSNQENNTHFVSSIERMEDSITQSTPMRTVIANRLTQSKQQIPHFYLSIDCNIDRLLKLRKEINTPLNDKDENEVVPKITINDFIIRAVALSMKLVPEINASWKDDSSIIQYGNIDISVAVAIEGGLITPIIYNADGKSIAHISSEMKYLANKAKSGTLTPEEYQGGSFTISNMGMYGISQFQAIINPPQSAILAVGAGKKTPVFSESDSSVHASTIVTLTLSVDHRVVDGAVGAKFASCLKMYLENPTKILL